MAEYNGKTGVWRTIGKRRVFIADGQSLSEAMKESGKFNKSKKITKKDIVIGDIYQGADGYWNYDLKEGIESDFGLPYIWNKTKAGANLELKLLIQRENILNERK